MRTWNCDKAKNGLAFGIGLMSKENIGLCAGQVWSVRTAPKVLKERDFQVKQKGIDWVGFSARQQESWNFKESQN